MMRPLVVLIGLVIAALGLLGLSSPATYARLGILWTTPPVLYVVTVIQVLIALVLLRAAPSSRSPVGLGLVGALALVEGILMPLLGLGRAHAFAEWWGSQSAGLLRIWALVELVVGVLVVCAVAPSTRPLRPAGSTP